MVLKHGIEISSAKARLYYLHKWAKWEVAIARISLFLFTSWEIIKLYTGGSIKLSRNNLFRQYFIEKNIIREAIGRKFERSDW